MERSLLHVANMNQRQHIVSTPANRRPAGFSLVELLTVVAIMAIMASLLAPAVSGFTSTAGRRSAINLVMNTIDQARVAALEQGRPVHIILARRTFPEPDAIQVIREDGNGGFETLTRWQNLPKGVIFRESGVFSVDLPQPVEDYVVSTGKDAEFTAKGALSFSPRGTVKHPNGQDNNRRIHLADEARHTANTNDTSYGFDIISVARYTGRPQLDVTFQ
jgi:prepilin-type N-terminal cleavage/methylation domain-containing protein